MYEESLCFINTPLAAVPSEGSTIIRVHRASSIALPMSQLPSWHTELSIMTFFNIWSGIYMYTIYISAECWLPFYCVREGKTQFNSHTWGQTCLDLAAAVHKQRWYSSLRHISLISSDWSHWQTSDNTLPDIVLRRDTYTYTHSEDYKSSLTRLAFSCWLVTSGPVTVV